MRANRRGSISGRHGGGWEHGLHAEGFSQPVSARWRPRSAQALLLIIQMIDVKEFARSVCENWRRLP